MSGIVTDLPQYRADSDYTNQERYQELLNLILSQWFNSDGFFNPTLTNAQVTQVLAATPAPVVGTMWYNSDLDKMQFVGAGNVAQTITSV